jgi:Tfp pilus assembly protein PilO
MPLNLSNREKIILSLTLLVAVSSTFWVFLIKPQFIERRARIEREILRKEEKVNKALEIIKERGKLEEEFRFFQEKAKSEVPPEKQVTTFLAELQTMAAAAKIRISDLKPMEEDKNRPKDDDFYKRISAQMNIECDLGALSKFLYGIQTSSRILDVRTLEISPKFGSSSGLRGKVLISTIILKGTK